MKLKRLKITFFIFVFSNEKLFTNDIKMYVAVFHLFIENTL